MLPLWRVPAHLRPKPRDEGFDPRYPDECPIYSLLPKPRGWKSADPTCGRFFDITGFLSLDASLAVSFEGEA